MKVKLTNSEILSGVIVGARRRVVSRSESLSENNGPSDGWSADIEGALAEIAVAKALGVYFCQEVGKFKSKDVGKYHVRQTSLENGSLIIRPEDPDGEYVLVVGSYGDYDIKGKCLSKEVKIDRYKKAPNNRPWAWFVPQDDLGDLA